MVIYHDFHKFISGEENAKDSQKAKTLYFIGGKVVKHNDKHMISKGKTTYDHIGCRLDGDFKSVLIKLYLTNMRFSAIKLIILVKSSNIWSHR